MVGAGLASSHCSCAGRFHSSRAYVTLQRRRRSPPPTRRARGRPGQAGVDGPVLNSQVFRSHRDMISTVSGVVVVTSSAVSGWTAKLWPVPPSRDSKCRRWKPLRVRARCGQPRPPASPHRSSSPTFRQGTCQLVSTNYSIAGLLLSQLHDRFLISGLSEQREPRRRRRPGLGPLVAHPRSRPHKKSYRWSVSTAATRRSTTVGHHRARDRRHTNDSRTDR